MRNSIGHPWVATRLRDMLLATRFPCLSRRSLLTYVGVTDFCFGDAGSVFDGVTLVTLICIGLPWP